MKHESNSTRVVSQIISHIRRIPIPSGWKRRLFFRLTNPSLIQMLSITITLALIAPLPPDRFKQASQKFVRTLSKRLSRSTALQTPELRTYQIGFIPPQEVQLGTALEFQLQSSGVTQSEVSYVIDPSYPHPQGTILLDSFSGHFIYRPSPNDKFQFRIGFARMVNQTQTEFQWVVIVPIVSNPPESELLTFRQPTPNPHSAEYVLVTQVLSGTSDLFNGVQQPTRKIDIAGKEIIFAANDPENNLFARFSGATDIRALNVYADKVIIRTELWVPGTDVTIYARELRFEDVAGQTSAINTTPKNFVTAAIQSGSDGQPGQRGGNISLYLHQFDSGSASLRFIARGGRGQDPGQGRDGAPPPLPLPWDLDFGRWSDVLMSSKCPVQYEMECDENGLLCKPKIVCDSEHQNCKPVRSVPSISPPFTKVVYEKAPIVCTFELTPQQCQADSGTGSGFGSPIFPSDGSPALAPGVPGVGGVGGSVISTLAAVQAFADLSGGAAGQAAPGRRGGDPQEPVPAAWARAYRFINGDEQTMDFYWCMEAEHSAVRGTDGLSRNASSSFGNQGIFVQLGGRDARWLHPGMVRMAINYAKDCFMTGNLDTATDIFSEYLDFLNDYGDAANPEWTLIFTQQKGEIETELLKLRMNLDFFGEPFGKVPFLSLEAYMHAVENEVRFAILTLYLDLWMERKASNSSKDVQSIHDSMVKLNQSATDAATETNAALANLPEMQSQADSINSELQLVDLELQNLERVLEQRARDNVEDRHKLPAWKKALRVISIAARLIPVKQPGVALIGQALDLLTNIDVNQPLAAFQQLATLEKSYNDSHLREASVQLQDFLNGDFLRRTDENSVQYFQRLSQAGSSLGPAFVTINNALRATQISDQEIEQEFERLKSQDSLFNEVLRHVSDLQAERAVFEKALAQTSEKISTLSSQISQNLLTIGSLYRQLDQTVAQIDLLTLIHVRQMGRAAKQRLLRFTYYLGKAYEYRMLRQFPGSLLINGVVDQLITMLSNDYTLDYSAFFAVQNVYLESLRNIVFQGLNDLEQQSSELSLPFFFSLSQSELQELNQTGSVRIDLAPLIAGLPNEERRYLASLGVAPNGIDVRTAGPVSQFGRVRILIEHQGESVLTAQGRTYTFGAGWSDLPFQAGGIYDLTTGRFDSEELSPAGLSLLRNLLGISGSSDDTLSLFARPGADSIVTIRKFQDPQTLNATITRLVLSAKVDFTRTATSQVWLSVKASGPPEERYVVVSQPDFSGRSDGRGSFRRAYLRGENLDLLAEPVCNGMRFAKWMDGAGTVLSTSTSLHLSLKDSMEVQTVYQGPGAPSSSSSVELVLEESGLAADQLVALESPTLRRDPFRVLNDVDLLNPTTDHNTRVIVFATNLQLAQAEDPSSVTIILVDVHNQTYEIPAEDVRHLAMSNLTQVIFRLPNNLPTGVCVVRLKVHDQITNLGTMGIRN